MTHLDSSDSRSRAWALSIVEGDIVTLGPNAAFTLEVVAVRGEKAWVRDLDDGREGVVDLASFRKFGFDAPEVLQ